MSDYNFLMESRLSPEQYAVLGLISRLAAEQGLNIYLVGGAVRDLTYGQQVVHDLDFAVEGSPQKILRLLPSAQSLKPARGPAAGPPLAVEYQVFDEHFSSAEMRFASGVRAELAMCREESFPRPGQRPEVRPASVFEDLKRRDFSINAMAISLHPNSRGLLLDPTNGAGDIERRELRALHSRSFLEDPVRIYRLLRLGTRLDFKPDERTQRWLDAALEGGFWERLEPDQQARELAAILHEDNPGRVLKMLADRKLLSGLDQKLASARLPYERFARIRSILHNVPGADPFLLNFHSLVEKLGGEHTTRLAKRILGDAQSIKLTLSFDKEARNLERLLSGARASRPSHVYALLSPQPEPLLWFLLSHTARPKVQNRIKSYLFKFPQILASLPRGELQGLGIKPGPEFERIMERIFALQLDGKIKSHQQLMKEMRALAGIKEPPPTPPPPPPKKTKEVPLAPPAHPPKKGKGAAAAPPPEAPAKAAPKGATPKVPAKPMTAKVVAQPPTPAAKPAKATAKPTPAKVVAQPPTPAAKPAKATAKPMTAKVVAQPPMPAAKPAKAMAKPLPVAKPEPAKKPPMAGKVAAKPAKKHKKR
jgi:tRNA nucleotidyltransferase (CCA-adding enzyme)